VRGWEVRLLQREWVCASVLVNAKRVEVASTTVSAKKADLSVFLEFILVLSSFVPFKPASVTLSTTVLPEFLIAMQS